MITDMPAEWVDRYIACLSPEVYFIRCEQFVKIGVSKDPYLRVKQIRRGVGGALSPAGLERATSQLVGTELGGFDRERELHSKFAHLRHTGEWFTEAPELTDYIKGLAA
jgi:hypothetical protein